MASRSFSAQRGTLVLSLVIATMLIVAPFVLAGQYVAALVLAAIYTVITAGLNLFMGYTGQISFGHNAFAAIGGYVSAILAMRLGWPPVITIALAAAAAALIALVVGYPTLRLRGHYLAMATLALGLMVFEIATQWKSMTQGLFGLSRYRRLASDRGSSQATPAFIMLTGSSPASRSGSRIGSIIRVSALHSVPSPATRRPPRRWA